MTHDRKTLTDVRSEVCNATLGWMFALAMLSGVASLSRGIEQGWQPAMTVTLILVPAMGIVTFARNVLPFWLRADLVIFLYFAGGVAGHMLFGTPYTLEFFMSAAIMTGVFFGERMGVIAIAVSVLTSISFYFVYSAGLLPTPSLPNAGLAQWVTNASRIAIAGIGPLIAITKFRQILEARRIEAEEANAAKSEFLAMMSHELRTPLTAVIGISDLLSSEKLPVDQQEKVSRISKAGEHLLELLNDILDFSKIEANQVTIERIPFNAHQLTTDLYDLLHPLAAQKNIELKIDISSDLNSNFIGDPTHIRRVLHNVVGNAIKFTERGTVAVRASKKAGENGHTALLFQVADTGIGISPEQQQRLFKPFTQADAGISRRFGGTGLGLSISSSLLNLMGGDISVSSTPGQGSTFAFTVPVFEDRTSSLLKTQPQDSLDVGGTRRLNVLVADDNEATRFLLESMLTRWGHSVKTVENGALALKEVQESTYHIVLMDMQMPEMDGVTATRAIRALDHPAHAIPIIALTADIVPENRESYRDSGLTDLIGKPVNWSELSEQLKQHAPALSDDDTADTQIGTAAPPNTGELYKPKILDQTILSELSEMVGADALSSMLQMMRENIQEYKNRLLQSQTDGDFDSFQKAAHALKGLCLQYGALRIGNLAAHILEASSFEECGSTLDEILSAIPATDEAIADHIRGSSSA